MCIFMIYKCWDGNQQEDLGKPSQEKIAKPNYQWEAAKHTIPCGEWKDSVCFEKRAKMDLFAMVCMYEAECLTERDGFEEHLKFES